MVALYSAKKGGVYIFYTLTALPVLRELYDRMKAAPYAVDLDALWQRLGVMRAGDNVRFNNNAPLAAIRRGIAAREFPSAQPSP